MPSDVSSYSKTVALSLSDDVPGAFSGRSRAKCPAASRGPIPVDAVEDACDLDMGVPLRVEAGAGGELRRPGRCRTAAGQLLPGRYHLLFRLWFVFGFPAFAAVLGIFWLMIARPEIGWWG